MKIFKRVLLVLLVICIIIQFFRPVKNLSGDTTHDISKNYLVPADVHAILIKACYDCHSNKTRYPWYAEAQPIAWWMADHIQEAKRKINFNEFSSYRIARQFKKLEDCMDEVKDGSMPLPSYTLIHRNAILTDAEKSTFTNWCNSVRDSIRARYPADSLIIKKK